VANIFRLGISLSNRHENTHRLLFNQGEKSLKNQIFSDTQTYFVWLSLFHALKPRVENNHERQ
jgi:hypothetical protein